MECETKEDGNVQEQDSIELIGSKTHLLRDCDISQKLSHKSSICSPELQSCTQRYPSNKDQ